MIKNCSKITLKFIINFLEAENNILSYDEIKDFDQEKRNQLLLILRKFTNLYNKGYDNDYSARIKYNKSYKYYERLSRDLDVTLNNWCFKDKISDTEVKLLKAMAVFTDDSFNSFLEYAEATDEIEDIILFINNIKNNNDMDTDYIESNKAIVKSINNILTKMSNFFGYSDLAMFINKITELYVLKQNEESKQKIKR